MAGIALDRADRPLRQREPLPVGARLHAGGERDDDRGAVRAVMRDERQPVRDGAVHDRRHGVDQGLRVDRRRGSDRDRERQSRSRRPTRDVRRDAAAVRSRASPRGRRRRPQHDASGPGGLEWPDDRGVQAPVGAEGPAVVVRRHLERELHRLLHACVVEELDYLYALRIPAQGHRAGLENERRCLIGPGLPATAAARTRATTTLFTEAAFQVASRHTRPVGPLRVDRLLAGRVEEVERVGVEQAGASAARPLRSSSDRAARPAPAPDRGRNG